MGMITVPKEIESKLQELSKKSGYSVEEIVTDALALFIEEMDDYYQPPQIIERNNNQNDPDPCPQELSIEVEPEE